MDLAQQAAYELLKPPRRPTVLVAGNDLMALGVIQAAAELGLRVPADLAVAGFDDIEIAAHLANQLMTVAQKRTEMGRLAAEGILQIIRDPQRFAREPLQRVLAPTLVIRRTCGAVQTTRGQTPQG